MRMNAMAAEMPPEQVPMIRSRMFDYIVDQFIMRTLLMSEADRLSYALPIASLQP